MAVTQLMRSLAREDVVRELTYTGRIFSAEEALAYGFATRMIADPLTKALATAREIAGRSPDAIRAAKRLLNQAVACDALSALPPRPVNNARCSEVPIRLRRSGPIWKIARRCLLTLWFKPE
jgi:hypothetical protein